MNEQLLSHLDALTARPFIPELHADDCDDTTCAACHEPAPANPEVTA